MFLQHACIRAIFSSTRKNPFLPHGAQSGIYVPVCKWMPGIFLQIARVARILQKVPGTPLLPATPQTPTFVGVCKRMPGMFLQSACVGCIFCVHKTCGHTPPHSNSAIIIPLKMPETAIFAQNIHRLGAILRRTVGEGKRLIEQNTQPIFALAYSRGSKPAFTCVFVNGCQASFYIFPVFGPLLLGRSFWSFIP